MIRGLIAFPVLLAAKACGATHRWRCIRGRSANTSDLEGSRRRFFAPPRSAAPLGKTIKAALSHRSRSLLIFDRGDSLTRPHLAQPQSTRCAFQPRGTWQ
jgi:hypothetical protein